MMSARSRSRSVTRRAPGTVQVEVPSIVAEAEYRLAEVRASKLRVSELRDLCYNAGISGSGNKEVLVDRVVRLELTQPTHEYVTVNDTSTPTETEPADASLDGGMSAWLCPSQTPDTAVPDTWLAWRCPSQTSSSDTLPDTAVPGTLLEWAAANLRVTVESPIAESSLPSPEYRYGPRVHMSKPYARALGLIPDFPDACTSCTSDADQAVPVRTVVDLDADLDDGTRGQSSGSH